MFREAALTLVAVTTSSAFTLIQKRDGAGGHDHSHAAAPVAADSGSGYAAPSAGYDQPAASYSSPSSGYGAVSSGYGNEPALPDLTPIIVALLVLTGLSLLFPTYVSLASVRRKRETGDDEEGRCFPPKPQGPQKANNDLRARACPSVRPSPIHTQKKSSF